MKSLQVLVANGTRLPLWLSISSDIVSVERRQFAGHSVRTVVIKKGSARFVPGGAVAVKIPGWGEEYITFDELKVFQIRDARSRVRQQNFFFCTQCFANTGIQGGSDMPPADAARGVTAILKFSCTCGNTWKHDYY